MNARTAGFSHRWWAAAVVILVTLVSGGIMPGSKFDRKVFVWMANLVHERPLWVNGFGSRETPWSLRLLTDEDADLTSGLPAVVWVGDDPDGVFQASPPSAVDYAVMFSNMRRLGVKRAACAVVLAWDDPDAIGLMALERALGGFETMVMVSPVTRGAVAEPMPQAYRRASLPLNAVVGDRTQIPVVNRIPVPDVLFGNEKTWAGFSAVESEPDGGRPFLCARWGDRVVFSFELCVMITRLGMPMDVVEIRLGEFVRIGRKGPMIPIDERGRMSVAPRALVAAVEKTAEGLIDAAKGWLPAHVLEPVILADQRGLADAEVREFSSHLSGKVAAIAGGAGLSAPQLYRRLSGLVEWSILVLVSFGLAAALWLPRIVASVALAAALIVVLVIQWLAFLFGGTWAPGSSMWMPIMVAGGLIWWPRLKLALQSRGSNIAARETD